MTSKTAKTVKSSIIHSVDYDPSNKLLTVQFKTGTTYQYYNVPQAEYKSMMMAGSIGSHFTTRIKHTFRGKKIGIK